MVPFVEGDPRTFDRDIFGRLSRLERWAASRTYDNQAARRARGPVELDRFEPPVSVARNAIVHRLYLAVCVLGAPVLLISHLLLAGYFTTGIDALGEASGHASRAGPAYLLVLLVVGVLRRRRVDRMFFARYGRDFPRVL